MTAIDFTTRKATPFCRSRQSGAVAVEFALVFIVFFAIFYAIVGFGIILVSKQSMTLAAEEGARAALRHPGTGNNINTRLANARAAAEAAIAWLPASGRQPVTATSETCSYTNQTCVRVYVRYNYSTSPLVPSLPFLGFIFPATLDSTAIMQVNSGS